MITANLLLNADQVRLKVMKTGQNFSDLFQSIAFSMSVFLSYQNTILKLPDEYLLKIFAA